MHACIYPILRKPNSLVAFEISPVFRDILAKDPELAPAIASGVLTISSETCLDMPAVTTSSVRFPACCPSCLHVSLSSSCLHASLSSSPLHTPFRHLFSLSAHMPGCLTDCSDAGRCHLCHERSVLLGPLACVSQGSRPHFDYKGVDVDLHHCPQEMLRVLKPGGWLIFGTKPSGAAMGKDSHFVNKDNAAVVAAMVAAGDLLNLTLYL